MVLSLRAWAGHAYTSRAYAGQAESPSYVMALKHMHVIFSSFSNQAEHGKLEATAVSMCGDSWSAPHAEGASAVQQCRIPLIASFILPHDLVFIPLVSTHAGCEEQHAS